MADSAPTAEDLLAHTEWLTRVARALVGDAAAGDVVQDTLTMKPTARPGFVLTAVQTGQVQLWAS